MDLSSQFPQFVSSVFILGLLLRHVKKASQLGTCIPKVLRVRLHLLFEEIGVESDHFPDPKDEHEHCRFVDFLVADETVAQLCELVALIATLVDMLADSDDVGRGLECLLRRSSAL